MKRKEVERFILSNNPDTILHWLANKATQEETKIAKNFMQQAINMAIHPCSLMDNGMYCSTGSIMGIS